MVDLNTGSLTGDMAEPNLGGGGGYFVVDPKYGTPTGERAMDPQEYGDKCGHDGEYCDQ